ncbi:MAG: hypothetical protein WCG94_01285, partial [Methanothrix sp.]
CASSALLHIIYPGSHNIFPIENPDEHKYSKNNIEVGDVHQPLKKTHLLLRRPNPVFRFSLKPVGHLFRLS